MLPYNNPFDRNDIRYHSYRPPRYSRREPSSSDESIDVKDYREYRFYPNNSMPVKRKASIQNLVHRNISRHSGYTDDEIDNYIKNYHGPATQTSPTYLFN